MKNQNHPSACRRLLAALAFTGLIDCAAAAIVPLTPANINLGDTNTAGFSNADLTLTPLQGGNPATFNANATRLGIDDFGTNANAFNDPDVDPSNGNEEQLRFVFAANAGLTELGWDFSRADGPGANSGVFITGFSADPGATVSAGGGTASYSNGKLTIKIPGSSFSGTLRTLTLANPGASTGATLLLSVTDEDQAGAQLAIRGISYENAVPTKAPVIDPPLPATLAPGTGVATTLTASLEPGTAPGPTFVWEYNNGSGFVQVATTQSHTFTAGPASNGSYRVTVTNAVGSDTDTVAVTAIDDGDGIDNQWETDNFGNFLTYGATDDVDTPAPDGLNNAAELAAGTDPNDPDTDGDGLLDGQEAANSAQPLLADTDGDGFSDGYEVNTAKTAANDPNDAPLIVSGRNSIGITFASTAGVGANINLGPLALAGAPGFVQKNWNATGNLPGGQIATSESDIALPSPGVLVDSAGLTTSASLSIQSAGTFSRLNNPDQSVTGLYSGYLFANAASPKALIDLNGIPYSRYDVVLYVMGFNENVRGALKNINSGIEYGFRTPAILDAGANPAWFRCADQTTVSSGTSENFPISTHVIFRGLSGTGQSFDLTRILDNPGIAAIQIVEDLDTDGDGMGNFYETSVGLDPNDNGSINPLQAPGADFDADTLSNISEHNNGTNPNNVDTDGDGINDNRETDTGVFVSSTDTGTDPRIADTDADTLYDGAETNTEVFVNAGNTGTNPLLADTVLDQDEDGWSTVYEINTGLTDPFNPASPSGPNPAGFAIAFNSVAGQGAGAGVEFGPLIFAGAPGKEQKNWNRTLDLDNTPADASGDISKVGSPNAGELVDSAGTVVGNGTTGVGVSFSAGRGAFSSVPEATTPYGRLFNSFIYGTTQTTDPSWSPDSTVTLTGIPYASYDVYVYFGSETNNRTGTVSSTTAGVSYSFTTQVVSGTPGNYLRTTDTGNGNPLANYAVFSGQSAATFEVKLTVGANQNTMGIYGIQVVETSGAGEPVLTLRNPQKNGNTFTADFTTDTAGTYVFERSQTLNNDWIPVGSPLSVGIGTRQLTDPAAPAGKAFYRVRNQ